MSNLKRLDAYRMDETECVERLKQALQFSSESKQHIQEIATQLVEGIRKKRSTKPGLDSFLHEYDLSTKEGVALMCLAEALLRIPSLDKNNMDRLIRDKLIHVNWEEHSGKSDSFSVNAATWGLMLTGKILSPSKTNANAITRVLKKLIEKSGEPIIRKAVIQSMRILGKQFVMGQTISDAITRAVKYERKGTDFRTICSVKRQKQQKMPNVIFKLISLLLNILDRRQPIHN
jgi:RHH-type transcriptional regulator, proline utilization regulon repressor / proline dehydrogenase / delta 1-pyrroline-5-carboxylate dehydrogenase